MTYDMEGEKQSCLVQFVQNSEMAADVQGDGFKADCGQEDLGDI